MRIRIPRPVLLCTFLLCLAGALFAQPSARPNILFIFSDDHSLQALGAYGGRMHEFVREHGITPHIDRLAEQGALFTNSFVTNSICGPSRAAILTGKHSQHNGFYRNGQTFNPDQWTLPEALQESGYATAIFGKWHLGSVPRGFDEHWVMQGQGYYYNPDFFVNGERRLTQLPGYASDVVTDLTIDWLEQQRGSEQPFFLCSWHKAPHRTWMPATRHLYFLDGVAVPEPANLFDRYIGRNSRLPFQTMSVAHELNLAYDLKVTPPAATTDLKAFWETVPPTESIDKSTAREFARMTPEQRQDWDYAYQVRATEFAKLQLEGEALTRWKYQAYMQDYLRCIKALDENVGRLLAYLEASGLADNTIVIYSSDQGFYNGEHGWYDKRWIYEESMRNPLIIRWPGVTEAGERIPALVQNIDYAPTLLEAAGLPLPEAIQGRSFAPLLRGETAAPWRESLLYTYYQRGMHGVAIHFGVRDARYKLIRFPETDEWEFYDLEVDPSEMHNIYGVPQYAEPIARLKAQLEALMAEHAIDNPLDLLAREKPGNGAHP